MTSPEMLQIVRMLETSIGELRETAKEDRRAIAALRRTVYIGCGASGAIGAVIGYVLRGYLPIP